MRETLICAVVAMVLAVSGIAQAATVVVDLHGDKDGFGIGVLDGEGFDYEAVGPSDGDGTDEWFWGDQSWIHTYDISPLDGPIVNASIEIFHGGDGQFGLSEVFINDISVGFLTDAEASNNYAVLDTLDLIPVIALLDGSDAITVQVSCSGDGWVLDYSELTVSSIPEPSTICLLGLGGLMLRRRKSA